MARLVALLVVKPRTMTELDNLTGVCRNTTRRAVKAMVDEGLVACTKAGAKARPGPRDILVSWVPLVDRCALDLRNVPCK